MPMIALLLLVVGWLPGAALFRVPAADRDRRAALPAEERVFWAVILSVAVSLTVVLGLAAAHRYSFRRLLVADVALALAIALGSRFRLRLGPAVKRPDLGALLPMALVLLGLCRFFPASEYVIGGKDPGVYLNAGIQIAQRGALVVHDPVVAAVPGFARDLFFPQDRNKPYYLSVRFMGFYILDPDSGAVVDQFPHLYSASIAIGYGIAGLTGALDATGIWAILGLLAVYFAGARLIGKPAAAAAAGLLSLHVVQVWFSRYPNAEVVMQALLFAALLANARAHVDGDRFFAPVAGLLLGLLLFLRFDSVLAVGGVAAGQVLAFCRGQRTRWTLWAPLGIAVLLCVWYLAGPMRAYLEFPVIFVSNFAWWQYAGLAAVAAVAAALLMIAARQPTLLRSMAEIVPVTFTIAVVTLAMYAFAFREPVYGKLAARDAYALRTFATFYLTVPALIAALVGYWLVGRRLFWRDPAFVTTVTVFSIFFFYKIRIVSSHFWMARRFLPVILPGALLLVAAAALAGNHGAWRRPRALRVLTGGALLLLLAADYWRAAAPVLGHVEYAGIIPRLEQLAARVGDRDLLLVESRDGSDVHVLGLPLAYIYARNVLVLSSRLPDKTAFGAFLDSARSRYARVLYIGGGGTDLLSPRWGVEPVVSERFQVPEYDSPLDAYPLFPRRKEFDYGIYAFAAADRGAGAPFDLDVGFRDDLHVLRFHAKEQSEGHTFRWSRDRSYVTITGLAPTSREVVFWMSDGGRPPNAPAADVTVLIGDQILGTAHVITGFRPYAFALPAAIAARAAAAGEPVRLTLQTTEWNPRRALGVSDDRNLGVMVDRVAVR